MRVLVGCITSSVRPPLEITLPPSCVPMLEEGCIRRYQVSHVHAITTGHGDKQVCLDLIVGLTTEVVHMCLYIVQGF